MPVDYPYLLFVWGVFLLENVEVSVYKCTFMNVLSLLKRNGGCPYFHYSLTICLHLHCINLIFIFPMLLYINLFKK